MYIMFCPKIYYACESFHNVDECFFIIFLCYYRYEYLDIEILNTSSLEHDEEVDSSEMHEKMYVNMLD